MTELVVAITLIALPDSLNPSLILTALFLAGGPHPARRTAVFTFAAATATFVGGAAVALGVGDVIRSLLARPSPTAKDAVTLAVGAALVGAACCSGTGAIAPPSGRAATTRAKVRPRCWAS